MCGAIQILSFSTGGQQTSIHWKIIGNVLLGRRTEPYNYFPNNREVVQS